MNKQGGFTLLEILVALAVLGLLLAGLTQGTAYGLRAWGTQASTVARQDELGTLDRLLRRMIAQADPGSRTEPSGIAGTAVALGVTTAVPEIGVPVIEVRLFVERDSLILRWMRHVRATALVPPVPAVESVLLRGVARVEFAYWGSLDGAVPAWHPAWGDAALPELVRVLLLFPAGDRRRWPPIIARPLREKPV